jgi:DNA polymerase III alpha subunit
MIRLSRHRLVGGFLLILLVGVPAFAQQVVTVGDLAHNPDRYDKQAISVAGTIEHYRERVSERGNPYTTFRLQDATAWVSVFVWKHQGLRNGLRVRVVGSFAKVRRVGGYIFYNEIQATSIGIIQSK